MPTCDSPRCTGSLDWSYRPGLRNAIDAEPSADVSSEITQQPGLWVLTDGDCYDRSRALDAKWVAPLIRQWREGTTTSSSTLLRQPWSATLSRALCLCRCHGVRRTQRNNFATHGIRPHPRCAATDTRQCERHSAECDKQNFTNMASVPGRTAKLRSLLSRARYV